MKDGARKIAISGAGGLIGGALSRRLEERGDTVVPLVRPGSSRDGISWDPKAGTVDVEALAEVDAVVHLAGESIAGVWTASKKRRILESRRDGTRAVAEAVASLEDPPDLVCASAVGFYGDRGDEVVDEGAGRGDGFLADVCVEWEAAAEPARTAGARTVHVRLGVVLSTDGGALAQMLTPFKMGVGGKVGSGRQWMSWIHWRDAVSALVWALDHGSFDGVVNAVAPSPARNTEFTRALGKALSRPTFLPLPAFAVRTAMGEMGQELLLASTRVAPKVLEESGFEFEFAELDEALADLVGR